MDASRGTYFVVIVKDVRARAWLQEDVGQFLMRGGDCFWCTFPEDKRIRVWFPLGRIRNFLPEVSARVKSQSDSKFAPAMFDKLRTKNKRTFGFSTADLPLQEDIR